MLNSSSQHHLDPLQYANPYLLTRGLWNGRKTMGKGKGGSSGGKGKGGNYPSTTGRPSGKGRGNTPKK